MGLMKNFCKFLTFGLLIICLSAFCKCDSKEYPRIAVVGGGIGGASAVHFLEEYFGPDKVHIDLFEPHNIGGRLSTLKVDGSEFEVGGSMIHSRNMLVRNFIEVLGLNEMYLKPSRFSLFDGERIIYSQDSSWKLVDELKLLYRYGLGPFHLRQHIEGMLTKFDRIYQAQADGVHFSTVEAILNYMTPEFVENLHESTIEGFLKDGFKEKFIEELIGATLSVNYGQTPDVHKFVGSVSTAGVQGETVAVQGGNRLIPEGLLEISSAVIIKARVTNITLQESGSFVLQHENHLHVVNSSVYDIVILATPLAKNIQSGIHFTNFPEQFVFDGEFHQTVATMVAGTLNYSYFGLNEVISQVISINKDTFFKSVGKIGPVDGERPRNKVDVWKVFSSELLTKKEMDILFSNRKETRAKTWLAYPHYTTRTRSDSFVLHPKLYYINAIEWAASAMEMSAIGGKNVAIMAFKEWTGEAPKNVLQYGRDEL